MVQGVEDEKKIETEINLMLDVLDIQNKRYTMSKDLSGGMKRKLRYVFSFDIQIPFDE